MPKVKKPKIRNLIEQQQDFWNHINPVVQECAPEKVDKGVMVYRRNVYGTRLRALFQTYQTVCRCLGEKYFQKVAQVYVKRVSPSSENLNYYGENFPLFLEEIIPYNKAFLFPYIVDVAKMDYAKSKSYFSQGQHSFKSSVNDYCIAQHVALISSRFNLIDIASDPTNISIVTPSAEQLFFIVWRHSYEVRTALIDRDVFNLLSEVASGKSISHIVEKMPNCSNVIEEALLTMVKMNWLITPVTNKNGGKYAQ